MNDIEKIKVNLLISNMQDARNNILERVKLRESSLIYYLGAVATILGIFFGNRTNNSAILLIIPFLSLGVTFLISFHNSIMNSLSEFIINEVYVELNKYNVDVPIWDNSNAMSTVTKRASKFRVTGFLFLILFPPLFALSSTVLNLSGYPQIALWAIGVICVLISFIVYWKTVTNRWSFHDEIFEDESD